MLRQIRLVLSDLGLRLPLEFLWSACVIHILKGLNILNVELWTILISSDNWLNNGQISVTAEAMLWEIRLILSDLGLRLSLEFLQSSCIIQILKGLNMLNVELWTILKSNGKWLKNGQISVTVVAILREIRLVVSDLGIRFFLEFIWSACLIQIL